MGSDPFLPTGLSYSALIREFEHLGFVHCILLGHIWILSFGDLVFSEGKWREKWSREGGGGAGRSGERRTVAGLCCMKKEFIFNKKGEIKIRIRLKCHYHLFKYLVCHQVFKLESGLFDSLCCCKDLIN